MYLFFIYIWTFSNAVLWVSLISIVIKWRQKTKHALIVVIMFSKLNKSYDKTISWLILCNKSVRAEKNLRKWGEKCEGKIINIKYILVSRGSFLCCWRVVGGWQMTKAAAAVSVSSNKCKITWMILRFLPSGSWSSVSLTPVFEPIWHLEMLNIFVCKNYAESILTCVNVSPVFFASCRFSSGVGYLKYKNLEHWIFAYFRIWKRYIFILSAIPIVFVHFLQWVPWFFFEAVNGFFSVPNCPRKRILTPEPILVHGAWSNKYN